MRSGSPTSQYRVGMGVPSSSKRGVADHDRRAVAVAHHDLEGPLRPAAEQPLDGVDVGGRGRGGRHAGAGDQATRWTRHGCDRPLSSTSSPASNVMSPPETVRSRVRPDTTISPGRALAAMRTATMTF